MATVMENEDLGWSYIEQLKANGAEAQGGNGGVFNAVANGTKPYGVVVDFLPIREAAKGSPVEFVFPEEGVSAVTEPVAIMDGASNLTAAQTFVDFLLSEEGQTLVQSQGYLPASDRVSPPSGFPSRDAIKLMPLNAGTALEEAEANKARFSELYGG